MPLWQLLLIFGVATWILIVVIRDRSDRKK